MPSLLAADAAIVGADGVRLDFTRATDPGACLNLSGTGQRVIGLELRGCATGHVISFKAARTQLADSRIEGLGTSLKIDGAEVRIGPRNLFTGFEREVVQVKGLGSLISNNLFVANGDPVVLYANASGGDQALIQNVFRDNAGDAVLIPSGNAGARIWFNTFHRNARNGISARLVATPVDLRNNVFSLNGQFGVYAGAADLSFSAPNAAYGNRSGAMWGGSPGGWVSEPPSFLAPSDGDLRPASASPLRDAGRDLGIDLNGSQPGRFFGAAPELGAFEVW
ncbi:MAG: right-handed parallel beta-helix repeat-containing protein [Myxococcales bacterium]